MKEHTARVIVQLPVDCATFVLNEKRSEVENIENTHKVSLIVVPNKHLETPHYEIERIRTTAVTDDNLASHERAPAENKNETKPYQREQVSQQKAVEENIMPTSPQPKAQETNSSGFLKRIFSKIIPSTNKETLTEKEKTTIEEYLERGGDALFLIEHILVTTPDNPLTEEEKNQNPSLNSILNKWGITIGNEIVIDLRSHASGDVGSPATRIYMPKKEITESITSVVEMFSAMPYFLSDEFTLVDASVAPRLWRLRHYGIELPKEAKSVNAYAERLFERDGFKLSLTEKERELRL